MSTSVLPTFWTPEGLSAAQAALLAQATSTDSDVSNCTALSASDKTSWSSFFASLKTFCQTQYGWLTTTNPDGSWSWGGGTGQTADQLQSYQTQLFAWQQKLQATCTLSQPVVNPGVTAGTDALTTVVKYAAIGVSFLAGAYVVGKVAGAWETASSASAYKADLRDRRRTRRRLRV